MNIGIDLDGTLDRNPEFYRLLLLGWGVGKRILLTARPTTERLITLEDLARLGIYEGIHYDHLEMYPVPYLFELDNPLTRSIRYLKDPLGVAQYLDMDHRAKAIEALYEAANPGLSFPLTEEQVAKHFPDCSEGSVLPITTPDSYLPEAFEQDVALWKAQRSTVFEIRTMFDDHELNVLEMRRAGVYVLHACSKFERRAR